MSQTLTEIIELPGREYLKVELQTDASGLIQASNVHAVGSLEFLELVNEFKKSLQGSLSDIVEPKLEDGVNQQVAATSTMLLREMVLKLKGQWDPPYQEEKLCHCRSVATAKVDLAIITGAKTPAEVSRQTSASTACGTCQPDVESMIKYRLGS